MKINKHITYVFIFSLPILLLLSCVDETWPELDPSDEDLLVVEGRITNLPGPYTVKLSRTLPMDSLSENNTMADDFVPFTNAVVSITDDQNNSETLTEIEPGIYKTAEGGIQGMVGKSYKLTIVSEDGKAYESDYEEILEPIGIDSIYTKEELVDDVILGYRFVVSSDLNPAERNFYKWELYETYEYHAPYNPQYEFNGVFTNAYTDAQGNFHPGSYSDTRPYNIPKLPNSLNLNVCWQTEKVEGSYRETTKYISTSKIDEFPLHFIYYGHTKLRFKYNLLVQQHSISEKAYNYLEELEEQNSYDENELYTKQPYQMRGNVRNINNSGEPVLGYFYTSGISEKRMYAPPDKRPKHKNEYAAFYCYSANLLSVSYLGVGATNQIDLFLELMSNRPSYWPVYFGPAVIYHPDKMPWDWDIWFAAYPKYCYDCREKGGQLEKPDFWE